MPGKSHHRRTGNQGMRMSMYIEKRRYVLGLLELLELNGATLANRPKGASYQFHPSPSPAFIYLSPPPPTLWHHQLYTSHNNTLHYPVVYSRAILSDHLFDVCFPTSLEKCRSTTFVLLFCLASSPPFAYGLSGTCYSRLPSRRMLPSKSFRSELLFYPSLIFISFRVSYLLTL